jgi:hypothetical protein
MKNLPQMMFYTILSLLIVLQFLEKGFNDFYM